MKIVDGELAWTAVDLDGISAATGGAESDQSGVNEGFVLREFKWFATAQRLMGNQLFHGISHKDIGFDNSSSGWHLGGVVQDPSSAVAE
ncbi:hypothetical protein [Aeromonas diversa]|uniref:hypothetical protein n=1 Tax=Aeromonas diversa TaxID=502790 RepID=UPI0034631D6C